jgi:hypothetical protein
MSHIHNVGGYPNSAAEIQAQLEQMRAARLARKAEEAGVRPARTFDSEVEAYDGRENQDESQQENQSPEGRDEESSERPGEEPGPEGKPGVRYA